MSDVKRVRRRWGPGILKGAKQVELSTSGACPKYEFNDEGAWVDLDCPPGELRPETTLVPGQSFGWKRVAVDQWLGVIGQSVLLVRQTTETTEVKALAGPLILGDIRAYFGLELPCPPLTELYMAWGAACPRVAEVAKCLPGVRVLQQDPIETVFAFICSQNNNVSRIALLMDRLRANFGRLLCKLPPEIKALDDDGPYVTSRNLAHVREFNDRGALHSFPSVETLAHCTDDTLRKLGCGYRAPYIRGTAQALLARGGRTYLERLARTANTEAIQVALCEFPGIGPKVADCIALFCLGQAGCIPVDVHVWRIATRDYNPELRDAKSLTPGIYKQVGDAFRNRFGDYAGWAHSLLFGAELAGTLRDRLPQALLREMDRFRTEAKQAKKSRQQELEKRKQRVDAASTVNRKPASSTVKRKPASATGRPSSTVKRKPASATGRPKKKAKP